MPGAKVGLGFRGELAADLLTAPDTVDFIEVVAEASLATPAARREAVALSRVWPVVPHGVKLSLGSAEGIDLERARRLGALARDVRAPFVTEHVAFVRAGGREIGHLTQVPFTREAARVVARNVAVARRYLPDVPLLLENSAWNLRWPDDELDEASFFGEIVERTGCDLLLDLANLYANALNSGADPFAVLAAYPLDRVAMVHVAGGASDHGFYFDTHAHAVPGAVFELLHHLTERIGPVPVVLERDHGFPPFADLVAELESVRRTTRGSADRVEVPETTGRSARTTPKVLPDAPRADELARAQADLAALLTDVAAPCAEVADAFGEGALARAREVLTRKRVDEALPFLLHLLPSREALRPLARACVGASARAPALAGVADAMRIAEAAAADPHFAANARIDLLVLRSRFAGPAHDGGFHPRVAPFVRRERLPNGRILWAFKGVGADAPTRLFEK